MCIRDRDRLGQSTLILTLNNSGNSNKTFQLDLDNKNDDRIQASFSEDTEAVLLTKQMEVASGAQAIVRIYALAGTNARADDINKLEVSVSDPTNGTEYARSGINIQVNPFHFFSFVVQLIKLEGYYHLDDCNLLPKKYHESLILLQLFHLPMQPIHNPL